MSSQELSTARWLVAGFFAVAALFGPAAAHAHSNVTLPPTAAQVPLADLQERIDRLVQSGFDRPDAALASLSALARSQPPETQRKLLLARGLIAANAGRAALAESAAADLAASADVLALGDSLLVKAALAQTQGQPGLSEQAAEAALEHYQSQCPVRPACDWRMQFEARQILARQGGSSGRSHAAREHALAAAELARGAGDAARQAWALAHAADLSLSLGDSQAAQQDLARAQRLARLEGSPLTLARHRIFETRVFDSRGDVDAARRAAEAGLLLARQGQSPRLEAVLLANLSDIHVKSGRPHAALRAVDRALPVVRRHADRRIEQVLLHNAALARIALGQREAARRIMEELLHSHVSTGADGDRAVALREFSEAFAASGDHVAALALYHRERELVAQITKRNREAALAELRSRFDRESQQRQLQLLARQNTLMSQQIDNRKVMQKVWVAGAAAVALAMGLVALLYRRVHRINRRLAHNHSVLREQSQRDPLTGLANRRALYEKATQLELRREFGGALLLVDIDHFKQVNDVHGHASGDLVLAAVAERLARSAGPRDLVVRWGGEEFLIFMPDAGLLQAQALAAGVLQAVGGNPVAVGAGTLNVTASVGYGSFPLPPARLPLNLERAINLADMALYTAKNQGRNRAVGITATQAGDAAALARVEQDFDQAWTDGRVTLLQQAQPRPVQTSPRARRRPCRTRRWPEDGAGPSEDKQTSPGGLSRAAPAATMIRMTFLPFLSPPLSFALPWPRLRQALPLAVATIALAAQAQTSTPGAGQAPASTPATRQPAAAAPTTAASAASAASAPPAASAASAPAAGTQRVEITGGRGSDTEQRRQSTAAKIVIGREEIDKFGDATVGEVLRRLPGVTTPGAPGRGGAPRLRGLGSGFTQLLIDGQRLPPGFSLDSLTPEQIERIEILRAPTAETGAQAIAGTINIITREGFQKRLNDLRIGTGVENGKPSLGTFWSHNDNSGNLTYTLSAGLFGTRRANESFSETQVSEVDSGLVLENRRTSTRSSGENVHLNLGARLQWRLGAAGDSLIVSPGLFANRGENAFRFDTVHLLRREPPLYADYGSGANDNSFFGPRVQLQYRQRLGDWRVEGGGTLRSSRSRNFNTRDEFRADNTALRSQEDRSVGREKGLQLNAKGSRTLGGEGAEHSLVVGMEAEGAERDDTRSTRIGGQPDPALAAISDDFSASTLRLAAYAQDEWSLNQHWAFHAGLRWEGITTRGDNGQGGRPENRNSVTTPLVHLLWKPDPKTRDQVRLSLTRSWRAPATAALIGRPGINRLYDPLDESNTETSPDSAGNPNLRPELATGIDLAFERYLQGGGLLSANLFHRRISDLMRSTVQLETVTWSNFPRYVRRNRNIGNATTQGLELESKFRLDQLLAGSPPVELRANLALFRSEVEGVPGPDNRLDQQSKATGNVGADYRLRGTPLTLGGNVNWVPSTLTRLAADETTRTTSKRQWDMFALWTFSPSVGLRLMANNLLPRDYATETFNDFDPDGGGAQQAERTRNLSGGPSHVNLQLRLELKL